MTTDTPGPVRTDAQPAARGPSRIPRGYAPTLALANWGIYFAVVPPALIGLALKVREIAGPGGQAEALALVTSVGAIVGLIGTPLIGRLSDRTVSRFGRRRPWLVGSSILCALALMLVGSAGSIGVVLVGWCLAQVAGNAAITALNATVADQVPAERRGFVSSLIAIGAPGASLAGTGAVSLLSDGMARFAVPGIVCAVLCCLFAFVLPDQRLERSERPPFGFLSFAGSYAFNPRRHRDFAWVCLNRFLMFFGYFGIRGYTVYFLIERFNLSDSKVAGTFFVANLFSVVGMAVAGPLCGYLSDRFESRRPFVVIAGLTMVVGFVALASAPSMAVVYVAELVIGLGFGSYASVDIALGLATLPNQKDAGKDLAVLAVLGSLPQSIAPAIAPAILALGAALPMGGYATWFLFGALVSLSGAFLVFRVKGVR
ncbi:MFS transporter [Streptomyces sp. NPDC090499]|uniref:MFS transporter n=1 Tax=Streptomyces sp. NPDC090499 TaxID=3365965 RepID=UPI0038184480